jgi:hypothetical protein
MTDPAADHEPCAPGGVLLLAALLGLLGYLCFTDPLRGLQSLDQLPADNAYCQVCHLNYAYDPFAEGHRKIGLGCVKCHGASEKHVADESHRTPPDRMYAAEMVNPSCLACHGQEPLPPTCVPGGDRKLCTDCHDTHRLQKRKRRWNKKTRKLIYVRETDGMGDM